MPTTRQYLKRPRRTALSFTQQQELWLGCSSRGSAFASEADVARAWARYKDRIMQLWGCHGRRPAAWWFFEGPKYGLPPRHPGPDRDRPILYEFGGDALRPEERVELEKEWRREWDKSWAPGFSYLHQGEVVTGQSARELHWVWCGLPECLFKEWMAERERHGQTIRELEQEGAAPRGEPGPAREGNPEAADGADEDDPPGAA